MKIKNQISKKSIISIVVIIIFFSLFLSGYLFVRSKVKPNVLVKNISEYVHRLNPKLLIKIDKIDYKIGTNVFFYVNGVSLFYLKNKKYKSSNPLFVLKKMIVKFPFSSFFFAKSNASITISNPIFFVTSSSEKNNWSKVFLGFDKLKYKKELPFWVPPYLLTNSLNLTIKKTSITYNRSNHHKKYNIFINKFMIKNLTLNDRSAIEFDLNINELNSNSNANSKSTAKIIKGVVLAEFSLKNFILKSQDISLKIKTSLNTVKIKKINYPKILIDTDVLYKKDNVWNLRNKVSFNNSILNGDIHINGGHQVIFDNWIFNSHLLDLSFIPSLKSLSIYNNAFKVQAKMVLTKDLNDWKNSFDINFKLADKIKTQICSFPFNLILDASIDNTGAKISTKSLFLNGNIFSDTHILFNKFSKNIILKKLIKDIKIDINSSGILVHKDNFQNCLEELEIKKKILKFEESLKAGQFLKTFFIFSLFPKGKAVVKISKIKLENTTVSVLADINLEKNKLNITNLHLLSGFGKLSFDLKSKIKNDVLYVNLKHRSKKFKLQFLNNFLDQKEFKILSGIYSADMKYHFKYKSSLQDSLSLRLSINNFNMNGNKINESVNNILSKFEIPFDKNKTKNKNKKSKFEMKFYKLKITLHAKKEKAILNHFSLLHLSNQFNIKAKGRINFNDPWNKSLVKGKLLNISNSAKIPFRLYLKPDYNYIMNQIVIEKMRKKFNKK